MLKRTRVGFFIWGTILLIFGIMFILMGCPVDNTDSAEIGLIVAGVFLSVNGLALIGIGIMLLVKKIKYNNKLLSEGRSLKTQCYKCGKEMRANRTEFRAHKRFPEGFVYCRSCRTPLSINDFTTDNEEKNC